MEIGSKGKKIWKKAREAIEYRRTTQDDKFKELDAFDRGEQWATKGQMASWIPRPSTNYIHRTKKLKTGNLILDDYLGMLKPLAPAQEETIFELQKFYEQLWDKLNLKYKILDVIRTSRLLGTGILYVGWDEAYIGGTKGNLYQGEVLIKAIEPSTFFVDPTAFDMESAMYCGTFIRTTKEHIKADSSITEANKKKYFDRRKEMDSGASGSAEDRGEIYNRDYSTYQDNVVDLITFYEKVVNEAGGFTIKVTYLADGIIIKEIETLRPNIFPFIKLEQYKQRQDFWGLSDCQLILPNVKMINKVQSIIGTLATLYQNPQKIVYEGAGIDPRIVSKYGNAYGIVYLSKHPELKNVIKNVDVADIPNTLLDYVDFLKNDINDFTGLTEVNTGASVGSVQGSKGVQSMIDRSLVGDQDEFTVFEQFLEKVSYAVLMNAIEYYSDNRTLRMENKNPNSDFEYDYVNFDSEKFQDISWDFSINIIQKLKNTEANNRDTMTMLSEWQLQYSPDIAIVTPEDMVKTFNPANRDIILARIANDRQQKSYEMASQITTAVVQGLQDGYAPELVAEIVFGLLNPQQGQNGLGDVQKQQQGLPQAQ